MPQSYSVLSLLLLFILTINIITGIGCKSAHHHLSDSDSDNKVLHYKLKLLKPNAVDQVIRLNYILTHLDLTIPTLTLCLGTPQQCFQFSLSFYTQYIYVLGYSFQSSLLKFYDKNYSVSYMGTTRRREFPYQSVPVISQLVYDYVSDEEDKGIKTSESTRCPFYVITDETERLTAGDIAGGLGLNMNKIETNIAPKGEDVLISYLNHLYFSHFIDHNSFTIEYNDVDGGYIQFGKAKSMTNNNKEADLKYCSSRNGSKHKWICNFHRIQIGHIPYNTNLEFTFDPSLPVIVGPRTLIEAFYEAIMNASNNRCKMAIQYDSEVLACSTDVNLNSLPDLTFIYSTYYFRLRMINMFKLGEVNGELMEVCLIIESSVNAWTLGLPAFKNRLLVFDQDDEMIGFYSEENHSSDNDDRNKHNETPINDGNHNKDANNDVVIISNKHNALITALLMTNVIIIIGGIGIIVFKNRKVFN